MKLGTVWFLVPTVFNLLVGLWWFALLPRDVMFRFMGKNLAATVSFSAGPAPRYGMWVMNTPARLLNSSVCRWPMPPVPLLL